MQSHLYRTLGALAEKCHAYAKALHYKELEFKTSPESCVEALISINNQLRQPEAAIGILTYAQQILHMELKVNLDPEIVFLGGHARHKITTTFLPPSSHMTLTCTILNAQGLYTIIWYQQQISASPDLAPGSFLRARGATDIFLKLP